MTSPRIIPVGEEPAALEPRQRRNNKPARNGKTPHTSQRFAILNAFVDVALANLTRSELATWLVLYRDTRNGTVRTSQADIGRRGGLSVRAVAEAIRTLKRKGLVTVVYRGGIGRGVSVYRVHGIGKKETRPPSD